MSYFFLRIAGAGGEIETHKLVSYLGELAFVREYRFLFVLKDRDLVWDQYFVPGDEFLYAKRNKSFLHKDQIIGLSSKAPRLSQVTEEITSPNQVDE